MSDECGCPEEVWKIGNLEVTMHIEPDGSGEVFIDGGDWEQNFFMACDGIEGLRDAAIALISAMPVES